MAAELKAIASLDGKKFEAGIRGVKGQTDSFASKLGSIKGLVAGAFTIGAVVSFGRRMLKMADDLNTAAQTAGITMQAMIGLQSAMAESGIKAEKFLTILSRLQVAQDGVISGEKIYTDALQKLNIAQDEFVSLGADQLIERLAMAYGDAEGEAEAFGAIVDLFGRRDGPAMIEVLKRINSEGFEKFKEGASEAEKGMTAMAQASDNLEKFMNKLTLRIGQLVGWLMKAYDYAVAFTSALFEGSMDGSNFEERMEKFRRNLAEDAAKAEAEAAAKRKQHEDEVAGRAKANIDALSKRRDDEEGKLTDKRINNEKRIAKERERMADVVSSYEQRRADIMAGKGVETPGMARVGSLQRIGGVVGGVAGAGDQAARIAQMQLNVNKTIESLTQESLRRLERIDNSIRDLGGE